MSRCTARPVRSTTSPVLGCAAPASAPPARRPLALALGVLVAAAPLLAQAEDNDSGRYADATSLDQVDVHGTRYAAGIKQAVDLKDIPQTISVISREQIELRNLYTLEDALMQTPGITVTGVSSEGQTYISRGFNISTYLIDGVPSTGYPGPRPDLTVYESVEVLRGASSLFSGAAQPGGAINLVRKRPQHTFHASGALLAGSWDNTRAEIDVGGPLVEGGQLRGRFAASAHESDMFYDVGRRERYVAYGVTSLDLGDAATLTVGAHYQDYLAPIQTGLPGYVGGGLLPVRRSTYLGADWNALDSQSLVGFAELDWRLGEDWRAKVTFQRARDESENYYAYVGNGAVRPDNGWVNQIAYYGDTTERWTSVDVNVGGAFELFGRDHDVMIGADLQKSDYSYVEWRDSAFARIDVFNPDTAIPRPAYQPNSGGLSKTRQWGVYGHANLSLSEHLHLLAGARLSQWQIEQRDGFTRDRPSLSNPQPVRLGPWTENRMPSEVTPFAGLTYALSTQWTAYGSYVESLQPQQNRTADGRLIDPSRGEQWEGGVKGALMDGRLLLSAAAYRIDQVGRAQPDPDNEGFYVAEGEVESKGVELEANGRITDNWSIFGGYAYNINAYAKDTTNENRPFTRISPKHGLKLFTHYDVTAGVLAGLQLGAGVNWYSPVEGGIAEAAVPTVVRQGGYAVFDALVGYRVRDNLTVRLNVGNLFDKVYYTRISATGRGNFYGEPRNVTLSLRTTF
jgi:outer-membrane receptor for ferric coprogen and ferric-rhodotorulic acid